jgi:hypothetical protein
MDVSHTVRGTWSGVPQQHIRAYFDTLSGDIRIDASTHQLLLRMRITALRPANGQTYIDAFEEWSCDPLAAQSLTWNTEDLRVYARVDERTTGTIRISDAYQRNLTIDVQPDVLARTMVFVRMLPDSSSGRKLTRSVTESDPRMWQPTQPYTTPPQLYFRHNRV